MAAATAQHAVISLPQLRALGLSDSAARKRAQRARLHRIHQGVYSLVPKQLLRPYGHWMAAILACGPGAVLSHRTAAALHELRPTQRVKVDVTVPGRTGRARKGIDVHRCTTLTRADVTAVNDIPCTSVARTLLDLAAVLPRRPIERAFDQAEIMQVLNLRAVDDTLRRNPTHAGVPTVTAILEEHYIGKTPTANQLEEAFFAICRRASARIPEVNQWIDLDDGEPPIKADFLWREQRVIVETDGRSVHGTHQAQQRDPRRDQRAILAGWTPIRAPWRQVMSRPAELERVIVRLVGVPRPAPPRAAAG